MGSDSIGGTLHPHLDLLRRLVVGDDTTLDQVMSADPIEGDLLDELTRCLMRFAAAVAIDPAGSVCSAQVDSCRAAGADDDTLVAVIAAVAGVIGVVGADLAIETLSLPHARAGVTTFPS